MTGNEKGVARIPVDVFLAGQASNVPIQVEYGNGVQGMGSPIVDEYGRPVSSYRAPYDRPRSRSRRNRNILFGAVVFAAVFGIAYNYTQQDSSSESVAAIGNTQSGVLPNPSGAESQLESGEKITKKAKEYVMTDTGWISIGTVVVNGYTPMTLHYPEYEITNPLSVTARIEGTVQILAKADPSALSVDESAKKSSGIYTISVDTDKLQFKTDLTDVQSGTSVLDVDTVFEAMRQEYEAAGDTSKPNPTMDDAKALIGYIQQSQGDVDGYTIPDIKTRIMTMYGEQLGQSALDAIHDALVSDAVNVQGINQEEIFFKFTKEELRPDLDPATYGDTKEIDFVTEDFTANVAAYNAKGDQLDIEETTQ